MLYVLDCSVALKWFLPEELTERALPLLERFRLGEDTVIAPEIVLAEFGHVLRKRVAGSWLPGEDARAIWADFRALGLATIPISTLADRAFDLALEHMATFYDALYVAAAESRDCTVVTADDGMSGAFGRLGRISPLRDL